MQDIIVRLSEEELMIRGHQCHQKKQLSEANIFYNEVLNRNPSNHRILHLKGVLENQNGNSSMGIDFILEALRLFECSLYYNNLAGIYSGLKSYNDSVCCYKKSLTLDPDQEIVRSQIRKNYGNLPSNKDRASAANEIGSSYFRVGDYQSAMVAYKEAIQYKAKNADAYCNMGLIFSVCGSIDKALQCYRKALKFDPNHIDVNQNYGQLLLKLGDFKQGAKKFRYRLQRPENASLKLSEITQWLGEPLAGKHLLLLAHQGVGDEVMFSSIFEQLNDACSKLTIEADKRMLPIFKRTFPFANWIEKKVNFKDRILPAGLDLYSPLGDAFYYCRKKEGDFSKNKVGLKANSDLSKYFKEKYIRLFHADVRKIGISWKTQSITNPSERSMNLDCMLPLFELKNTVFINLQYGNVLDEIKNFKDTHGGSIYIDEEVDSFEDLDCFLAQINALDHVISIDNSTVHFSGAIGVDTHLLLPISSDHRWLLNRSDCILYDSLRLYRQKKINEWNPLVMNIVKALV